MTKEEVIQKIKKILAKDLNSKNTKLTVVFSDKKRQRHEKKSL